MIFSNDDLLRMADEAFSKGFKAGKISGIDPSYLKVAKAKFLNEVREKLGLPVEELPTSKGGH